MLLLQTVDSNSHAEPDGIEHDERDRTRDIALTHTSETRRLLPGKRETQQKEKGEYREADHPV